MSLFRNLNDSPLCIRNVAFSLPALNVGVASSKGFKSQRGKVWIFHLAFTKCTEKEKCVRAHAPVLMAVPSSPRPMKLDANGQAPLWLPECSSLPACFLKRQHLTNYWARQCFNWNTSLACNGCQIVGHLDLDNLNMIWTLNSSISFLGVGLPKPRVCWIMRWMLDASKNNGPCTVLTS